jgi:hypothetical protein
MTLHNVRVFNYRIISQSLNIGDLTTNHSPMTLHDVPVLHHQFWIGSTNYGHYCSRITRSFDFFPYYLLGPLISVITAPGIARTIAYTQRSLHHGWNTRTLLDWLRRIGAVALQLTPSFVRRRVCHTPRCRDAYTGFGFPRQHRASLLWDLSQTTAPSQ